MIFTFLVVLQTFWHQASANDNKVCENLYEASCLGKDGKNKFAGDLAANENRMRKIVGDARDKTARELEIRVPKTGRHEKVHRVRRDST